MRANVFLSFLVGVGLTVAAFVLLGSEKEHPLRGVGGLGDAAARPHDMRESPPMLEGRSGIESMGLTPDEMRWVRESLATERRRRDAARIREGDTGITILNRVLQYGADPSPLFESYETFRSPIVESEAAALVLTEPRAGETVSFRESGENRVVIELGPGRFPLDHEDQFWRPVYAQETKVTHVVIRGAGMDRTTLVAGHQWALLMVVGTAEHVVIRDLTLEGGAEEGALLDIRGRAAVALENVRVGGWKVAGQAAAIGVSGNAYLGCRGCEFLGRGQGGGWAISLRGNSIVYCESSRFAWLGSGAIIAEGDEVEQSAALFRDCEFDASRLCRGKLSARVSVIGGRVAFGSPGLGDEERRERWGEPYAHRVQDVAFVPASPICTLENLLHVLEMTTFPDGEQVVSIALDAVYDGRPSAFRIQTLPTGEARTKTYVADVSRGRLELTHLPGDGGRSLPPHEVVRRAKSFLDVLKGSEVPLATEVTELEYRWQNEANGRPFPTIAIADQTRRNAWHFNAESAELLHRPE